LTQFPAIYAGSPHSARFAMNPMELPAIKVNHAGKQLKMTIFLVSTQSIRGFFAKERSATD